MTTLNDLPDARERFTDPWGHCFPWGALPNISDDLLGMLIEENVLDDGAERSWQERGLCAQTDPEAFFPEKGGSTREAKRTCLACEVSTECLEYALAHDERYGVWGGLSPKERQKLKRRDRTSPS